MYKWRPKGNKGGSTEDFWEKKSSQKSKKDYNGHEAEVFLLCLRTSKEARVV